MITIEQLLESVDLDLDFEPRWVTKDTESDVVIWAEKPTFMEGEYIDYWSACGKNVTLEKLKLAEFDGKDCTECIYEVPRWDNPDGQILKLQEDSYYNVHLDVLKKINELVEAVNELKGAKNE